MLSKEFLDKYPDFPSHMGELSKFVYYRTYSRWLPEENRRETWKETCARAVDYNCSLAPIKEHEDEQLFDSMFNLKQFISGRSLWTGGSKAVEKAPLSGFNCAFVVVDSLQAFADLFYLLMVGTGVGFRILPTDVAKLPKFKDNVKLRCFYHSDKPWGNPTTTFEHISDKSLKITVGDSKEGWVTALEQYLEIMTGGIEGVENLYIDFSRIRPKGTPLKTFGGTASGFQSVKEMFEKLHSVITEGSFSHKPVDGKLEPIHCLDICNLIGQNVVVGGVRRTAEIAIISPDDKECVNAKRNLTPDKFHRFMSNNSVYLEHKPSKESLAEIFASIKECGEPGFINVNAAKKRRDDFAGCNPCVLGDTLITIKENDKVKEVEIQSVVGKEVTVWNGWEWSKVIPNITGYNQPMLEISFSNGSKLKCTDYHRFLVEECYDRVKAKDLKIGFTIKHFMGIDGYLKENIKITNIKRIENAEKVYCFTEPINHTGVFNGIMTGQCGEVLLPPNAVCNLTTINLMGFINEDGTYDIDGLESACKISARAAYRMTCVNLELPEWNKTHHKDRLLGCSLTGYQDLMSVLGYDESKQCHFLDCLHEFTRDSADKYADELGTPKSLLATSLKPEGSLSLISNAVSPGIHFQHSQYFIRRIRVNASDPLAKTAVALGWRIHPEVGQTMDNATTLVIDFPCHSPSTISKNDVSAVQQLDIYRMFQKHYTEQNTSNTITVKPHEWEDVTNYVYDNWEDILAVTFLATDGKNYPLMPYEECTKEEYEELKSKMKKFDPEILNNMEITTRNFGQEYEILDDRTECASGVCPIR